mmetsp:Transcript_19827/g.56042  ORF Transcript_19827/g.56042 Transcript_19827/m.56042 type:complete len:203 (-) Transcript_19827:2848-3456(-)
MTANHHPRRRRFHSLQVTESSRSTHTNNKARDNHTRQQETVAILGPFLSTTHLHHAIGPPISTDNSEAGGSGGMSTSVQTMTLREAVDRIQGCKYLHMQCVPLGTGTTVTGTGTGTGTGTMPTCHQRRRSRLWLPPHKKRRWNQHPSSGRDSVRFRQMATVWFYCPRKAVAVHGATRTTQCHRRFPEEQWTAKRVVCIKHHR